MTKSDVARHDGLPWPEDYTSLRPLIEEKWRTTDEIYLTRKLSGGKSGAQVYLADVTSEAFTGLAILKLDQVPDPKSIEISEAARHERAYRLEPAYSERHLPKILSTAHDDHRIAILSTVAARGLEFAHPWATVSHAQQVDVLKRLSYTLLKDWNAKAKMARGLLAPQILLKSWLAHRLDPNKGRLHETVQDVLGLAPTEPSFTIQGRWLPNPLAFCLADPEKFTGVQLRAIEGQIHGDLHGHNVLVSQTGSSRNRYFMIDLAHYEQRQFLFFDHTYFAISLLLSQRGQVSDTQWLSIADEMCPFDHIKSQSGLSSDDVGLTDLLKLIRTEAMEWVNQHQAHRLSYMEAQFQLSQIAASLNFTNKRIDPRLRRLAFIHAACVLKDYLRLHNVDWPTYGPPINENQPGETAEAPKPAVARLAAANTKPETEPALPDGPSIAVMAFENLSEDDDQKFLVFGLADEVITDLSRVDWLMVISRGSSFKYRTGQDDPKQMGRELGVHYVVEGSVLRVGERVRVTVDLVDAQAGNQIWTERFEQEFDNVFDLQQDIATTIVGQIETELKRTERESARKKSGTVTLWESFQKAMWHYHRRTEEDSDRAYNMLSKLTDLGAGVSGAHAALAVLETRRIMAGQVDDVDAALRRALGNAREAVELDERSSFTHLSLSRVYSLQGRFDQAMYEAETCLELNPSSSVGYLNLAVVLIWGGHARNAVPAVKKSMRLSPKGPMHLAKRIALAFADYYLDDFSTFESLLLPTTFSRFLAPFSQMLLAAGYVQQGRIEDGQAALGEAVQRRPELSGSWLRTYWRTLAPAYRDKLLDDLKKAGLPE